MPKPVTPLVGCDVFIVDERHRLLLIRRSDNGYWALPGGYQDLGETPAECAVREVGEETGYDIKLTRLLGVFSSMRYPYIHYQWTENECTHLFYAGEIIGGAARLSNESTAVEFFAESELPELSDGHDRRIKVGFESLRASDFSAVFE